MKVFNKDRTHKYAFNLASNHMYIIQLCVCTSKHFHLYKIKQIDTSVLHAGADAQCVRGSSEPPQKKNYTIYIRSIFLCTCIYFKLNPLSICERSSSMVNWVQEIAFVGLATCSNPASSKNFL